MSQINPNIAMLAQALNQQAQPNPPLSQDPTAEAYARNYDAARRNDLGSIRSSAPRSSSPLGLHLKDEVSDSTKQSHKDATKAASQTDPYASGNNSPDPYADRLQPIEGGYAAPTDRSFGQAAANTPLSDLMKIPAGALQQQTVQPGSQMTVGRGIPGEQGYQESTTQFGGPNGPQLVVPPIEDRLNAYEGSLPPAEAAKFAISRRQADEQSQRDQFDHFQTYVNSVRKQEAAAQEGLVNGKNIKTGQPPLPAMSDDELIKNYQKLRAAFGGGAPGANQKVPPTVGSGQSQTSADLGSRDVPNLPHAPAPGTVLDATQHLQQLQMFLKAAGGDKDKARQLAKQNGWSL